MSRNDIYDYACPSGLYKCGGIAPIKATDEMTQAVGQRNGQLFTLPSGGTAVIPDPTNVPDGYVLSVQNGACVWAPAPSGLPDVTAADNGKVMTVVGGTWAAADPVSGDISIKGRRFRGRADIEMPDAKTLMFGDDPEYAYFYRSPGVEQAVTQIIVTATKVTYINENGNEIEVATLDSGLQWDGDDYGQLIWFGDNAPDMSPEDYEWFISLYEEIQ